MPITDNMRMRIFAVYIGAPVLCKGDREIMNGLPFIFGEVHVSFAPRGNEAAPLNDCQLLLRPISSLTDEEYVQIAKLLGREIELIPDEWHEKRFAALGIKEVDPNVKLKNIGKRELQYMKGNYSGAIIDYLRSINIITTVHGVDLVADEIAILDSENGAV